MKLYCYVLLLKTEKSMMLKKNKEMLKYPRFGDSKRKLAISKQYLRIWKVS